MDTYGFEGKMNNLSKWMGECSDTEQCQNHYAFVGKVMVQRQEFIQLLDKVSGLIPCFLAKLSAGGELDFMPQACVT